MNTLVWQDWSVQVHIHCERDWKKWEVIKTFQAYYVTYFSHFMNYNYL
jgi:hypothetical protein